MSRFLFHKTAGRPIECEDAIAVAAAAGRFAVADGATEGFDSRRWARYLARAWAAGDARDAGTAEEVVRRLGRRLQRRRSLEALPWYLEERARQGAFAAFVGLWLRAPGTWHAVAMGDACLFQEGAAYFRAFPLADPGEFQARPFLVPSRVDDHPHLLRHARSAWGIAVPGDCFLLMSDAIACWYLAHGRGHGDRRDRLHGLMAAGRRVDLEALVTEERVAGRLRNDDVAILRVQVLAV